MGVLESVGILDGGKISDAIRDKFIEDVQGLLGQGNIEDEPFWFVGIPLYFPGGFPAPGLEDREKFPAFHTVFIDAMLEGTAKVLDLPGGTPLFPVADPCAFGLQLNLPLPDISLDLALSIFPAPTPDIMLELLQVDPLDIPDILLNLPSISIPGLPSPPSLPAIPLPGLLIPIPTLPIPNISLSIPLPSLPGLPIPKFPAIPTFSLPTIPGLPSLLGCIFAAIPLIFIEILASIPALLESLPKGPLGIISFFAGIVISVLLACFEKLGLAIAKMLSFVAGLVVYIKYLVIFFILAIIASLLGDGCLTLGLAGLLLA